MHDRFALGLGFQSTQLSMISAAELRTVAKALEGLPDATMDRMARAAIERRYVRNAILYRAGAPADGLYVILGGRVSVSRETADHVELLHTENEGGLLGEIPAFGGGPFPATATALEPTRCAHVALTAVRRLLHDDPEFVRFALRRLAERARGLLRRIDELTATTITARVADHVLTRAGGPLGTEFTLGMSQEQLAGELGTAREVVVRALRALVDAGAVERTGRSRFRVRNLTMLRTLAAR